MSTKARRYRRTTEKKLVTNNDKQDYLSDTISSFRFHSETMANRLLRSKASKAVKIQQF